MNRPLNKYFYFIFMLMFATPACSQGDDAPLSDSVLGIVDTSVVRKYKFIQFGLNRFVFPNRESRNFEKFYSKFDSLTNYDGKDLVVYHIGGSHIQADMYTNQFRKHVQEFGPGLQGSRGWIFPYTMIETNGPSHYKVESIGEWKGVFNTMRKDTSDLGLMGAAAVTSDSISNMKVYFRKSEQRYFSNKVRVYHNTEVASYRVEWEDAKNIKSSRVDENGGYTEFLLKQPVDTIPLRFVKTAADNSEFRLYGAELLIDEPGFIYNTIGINGAGLTAYDRCVLFEKHLKQTKPDMFIISIGTNEANVDEFKPEDFEKKYSVMVDLVLGINPNCALLFTVPNDAYYMKKAPNKNVPIMRESILKLAKKYDAGVYDWFSIMGGLGSSQLWMKQELMQKDRIHFTRDGYLIEGDMMYEAFLKYLDEYEFNRLVKSTDH
ncbi:MAG TPA: GDSL-type esterase/lipase family protein [Flavobacteriales bacterium]|nr:GDSL-type esterase/lipase family protein [Flavobacteriales bacterium]